MNKVHNTPNDHFTITNSTDTTQTTRQSHRQDSIHTTNTIDAQFEYNKYLTTNTTKITQLLISNHDYLKSCDHQFYSDILIKYGLQRMILPFSSAKIMTMKSIFYTTLTSHGSKRVEIWNCNKDLFQKEIIFIPINLDYHWLICVIINPNNNYNKFQPRPIKPQIMVLDSADVYNKTIIANNICNWIKDEWRYLNNSLPLPKRYYPTTIPTTVLIIPKQTNGYNCSVYICKYVQDILETYHDPTRTQHSQNNIITQFAAANIKQLQSKIRSEIEYVNAHQNFCNLPINSTNKPNNKKT